MIAIAQSRLPDGLAIVGDALHLVVADHAFDRVFTGPFYGHLPTAEREAFLAEARRVAGELVVARLGPSRPGIDPEQWQERVLNDGKPPPGLQALLHRRPVSRRAWRPDAVRGGTWFVAARATW